MESKTGKSKKNDNEGITIQKTFLDRELICSTFLVSIKIHINAKKETSGMDARMLPAIELRFEISLIRKIKTAETSIFIILYNMLLLTRKF
ncbi:MAG: hypothetical protein QM751_02885 [Paludibacteraceae bacterium]